MKTKIISNLITGVCALMLLILAINYMEILHKNVRPNPTYSNWNLIVKFAYSLEDNN